MDLKPELEQWVRSIIRISANELEKNIAQPFRDEAEHEPAFSTGFCIKYQGEKYIVTCAHCVEGMSHIYIDLPPNVMSSDGNFARISSHVCDFAYLMTDFSLDQRPLRWICHIVRYPVAQSWDGPLCRTLWGGPSWSFSRRADWFQA